MKLGKLKSNVWEKKVAERVFRNTCVPLYPKDKDIKEMTIYEQGTFKNTYLPVVSKTLAELSEAELVVDEEKATKHIYRKMREMQEGKSKGVDFELLMIAEKLSKALSSSMSEWLRLERGKE